MDRISSLLDPLVPLAEGSLASTACARLFAPKQSIPHQSFCNLTSLAGGFSFFLRCWVFFGLGGGGGDTQADCFFFARGGGGGGGPTLGSLEVASDGDGLTLGSWAAAGDGGSTLGYP